MKKLKNHFNIKIAISGLGLLIGVSLFLLNRTLISNVREETNFRAEKLIEILTEVLNQEDKKPTNQNTFNILEKEYNKFIQSLTFPIIISNKENECIFYNIKVKDYNEGPINCDRLTETINAMDKKNKPIPIVYEIGTLKKWGINTTNKKIIQVLHFGDPLILTEIIDISSITILFFILFVIIFIWGFYYMKSNERDLIYVGMSKEAAHQLGTPLSSLYGWIELLEEEKDINSEILLSLKKDVNRISEVADRFSKIGSKLNLETVDLINILKNTKKYFDKRISKNHKIVLNLNKNQSIKIKGDKILLFWAFENIIKNSIDAIEQKNGKILINLTTNENQIYIDFIDNGKGLSRKQKHQIFKPGYSTKPRGWGLGLSLTKRIIEITHLGQLQLISSSKNKKTVFRIIL